MQAGTHGDAGWKAWGCSTRGRSILHCCWDPAGDARLSGIQRLIALSLLFEEIEHRFLPSTHGLVPLSTCFIVDFASYFDGVFAEILSLLLFLFHPKH